VQRMAVPRKTTTPEARPPLDPTIKALADRIHPDGTLVALAISGGGTRAAYFAAAVIDRLAKVRVPGFDGAAASLIEQIDLVSSVSGGSVASAYFALNRPNPKDVTEEQLAEFLTHFKEAVATAEIGFPIHPHMLRHAAGFKLANDGVDTRAIQDYLGHKSIANTVRYSRLSPERFKTFRWKD
jgi:predicted acylesterase/phospholipase RssA